MSTQVVTPDLSCKPMTGKYDGRKNNGRYQSKVKRGPKPFFEQHLAKNTAAKLFRNLNLYEKFAQLLDEPDPKLRFEVMRYLWDRLEGKPFVAANPAISKPQGFNDQRLQVAINELNIGISGTKALKGSKSKRIKGESLTTPPAKLLETKATSDNGNYVNGATVSGATTSDDARTASQDGVNG